MQFSITGKYLPLTGKKVYVAGHDGLVGTALLKQLDKIDCEVLTIDKEQLDLRYQDQVCSYLTDNRPDCVFLTAARVGGIKANRDNPVSFLLDNLNIQNSVISAAHQTGVQKLMFFGSTCIYPPEAEKPIREEALLTGLPEPTNEWYAVAKIAGIKLIQAYRQQFGKDFISVTPSNLYGPFDRYHLEDGHVIPSLLQRFHAAKINGDASVTIWGSGLPRREFLYVDDLAEACIFLMENYSNDISINVSSGTEVSIRNLAEMIQKIVGYQGEISFDTSMPDGAMSKLSDNSRIKALGWSPKIGLEQGLQKTYGEFLLQTSQ